jgi:hypothetical protein
MSCGGGHKKGHGAAPFYFSLYKTLGQLEPNLAGMFLGWSSTKKCDNSSELSNFDAIVKIKKNADC